jgi:hypothetical protein
MEFARLRPVERNGRRGTSVAVWAVFLVSSIFVVVFTTQRGGRVSLLDARVMKNKPDMGMQGQDGMEVDLSTLPRSAQMQDLAHVGGTAMGKAHAHYDALLSNGPLDPPRARTIQKLASDAMAGSARPIPAGSPRGTVKIASGIGLGGQIHLLRSAKEILAGKMASALEKNTQSANKAQEVQRRSGMLHVSEHQEQMARAVWQPVVKPSLKQRAEALEDKVRKLEDAAGQAEISNLSEITNLQN